MNLFEAIKSKDIGHVKLALQHNPQSVFTKDERGFPPLVLASYLDLKEITEMILAVGAPVDDQDVLGNSALIGVSFKGNETLAKIFLDHGADINFQNLNGTTPLMYATTFHKVSMVKFLLGAGADPNMKDNQGNTAADIARQKGFQELADFLTEAMRN